MSKRLKQLNAHPPKEALVEKLSHEGRGVTHIQGKTTFLFNALPQEHVQFRYTQTRSRYDEGKCVNILDKSPHRVTPLCPHFTQCGGCQLQHLDYAQQLRHKINVCQEHLIHQAGLQPDHWLPPLVAHPWQYRSKARLGVKDVPGKGNVLVGFRERNTPYLVEMNSCSVLDPRVGEKIAHLREAFSHLSVKNKIPQIEVAITQKEVALIIRHLVPLPEPDERQLIELCQREHFKLYTQPQGPDSITLLYPKDADFLMSYTLESFSLTLSFHPAGFMQINPTINQQMVSQAIDLLNLNSEDRVLDLFCGVGNFSLPAATRSPYVTGLEGDAVAVSLATHNAEKNHLPHCKFFSQNLFEITGHEPWLQSTYDKVILDPPRTGAQEVIAWVHRLQPTRIVYVSCNPITFARDAKLLCDHGYRLSTAGIMDMFPQTHHAEIMGLFIHT